MTTTPTDPGAIDLEEIKTCHLEGSRGQWSSEADKYRREFFTKHGPTLIAEVEALRERVVELAGALDQLIEEKADYMRLNNLGDPEKQYTIKAGRAALAATPAEALERARAKDEIVDWVREIVAAGDVVGPRALAKLDALGKEKG